MLGFEFGLLRLMLPWCVPIEACVGMEPPMVTASVDPMGASADMVEVWADVVETGADTSVVGSVVGTVVAMSCPAMGCSKDNGACTAGVNAPDIAGVTWG